MFNLYWKVLIPGKRKPVYLLGCEDVAKLYAEKNNGDLIQVTEEEAEGSGSKIKYLGDM